MLTYFRRQRILLSRIMSVILWLPLRILGRLVNQPPQADPGGAIRILVQDGYRLGDIVMLSSSLRLLRAAYPRARIHLIGPPAAAPLVGAYGLVDGFFSYKAWWAFPGGVRGALREVVSICRILRRERFDLAVDFRGDPRGLLLLFCSRIGRRVSFADFGGSPFLTSSFKTPDSARHQFLRSLYLVSQLTGSRQQVPAAPFWPLRYTSAPPPDSHTISCETDVRLRPVLIHPATSNPSKLWPAERFGALIGRLEQEGYPCELVGTPDDDPQLLQIRQRCGRTVPIRHPDVETLAPLLQSARLLICLDSFIQHVAWALSVPTLALWGPSNPHHMAPFASSYTMIWNDQALVPPFGGWSGPQPMNRISVDFVCAIARSVLKKYF